MAKTRKPEHPGTVTQAQLLAKTLETMEDDLRISPKQGRDFAESLRAVVKEAMASGQKVSLFGIVNLNTGFKLAKPRRKGTNPRSGQEEWLKASPAKVTVRATVAKAIKDTLPGVKSAAGQQLQQLQEHKAKEAAKRAKLREQEG
jgi:nucleoid DNA-binding protein